MNDRSKESQLLLGLLAILMLVTSVVLFAQQIPPTSSGVSKGQTEGARPQDSFVPSYITHSPITITSNADFVSQGFSGNGTAEDPYVIEGYNITTTGDCISIQDTDVYFIIRDCLLTAGTSNDGTVEINSENIEDKDKDILTTIYIDAHLNIRGVEVLLNEDDTNILSKDTSKEIIGKLTRHILELQDEHEILIKKYNNLEKKYEELSKN